MGKKNDPPAFEDALRELETIVERMEDGEPSLEESLKLFERGTDLARRCQKALDEAEQRIRTLADSEPSSPRSGVSADPADDA